MFGDASLAQLEYFFQAAKEGSFSKAAEKLHVSQPTLSLAVANLENTFGVQLFTRIPRQGVELTLAGTRLLHELEPLLNKLDGLRAAVHGSPGSVTGEITLGIYLPIAPFYLAALTKRAAERFPDLTLHFVEGDIAELVKHLERRQVDAAIMYAENIPFELGNIPLADVMPHIAVHEGHPLASAGRASLVALSSEPVALISISQTYLSYQQIFERVGTKPNVAFTSSSYEVIRTYVASGLAYSILHHRQPSLETQSGGRIALLDIEEEVPPHQLSIVTPSRDEPRPQVRHIAELMQQLCQEFPP